MLRRALPLAAFFAALGPLAAQEGERPEFAVPMVDFYSSDPGARRGDLEVNYAVEVSDDPAVKTFAQNFGFELAVADGLGIEAAYRNQPLPWAENQLARAPDFLELTGQFSHVFHEKTAVLGGVEFEKAFSLKRGGGSEDGFGLRPFVRAAAIFFEKIHVQGGVSAELGFGEEREVAPIATASFFYRWPDLQLGLELNGAAGDGRMLLATPQVAFSAGRLTLATGLNCPVLRGGRLGGQAFFARATVCFERE